jgi:hypothetical protein
MISCKLRPKKFYNNGPRGDAFTFDQTPFDRKKFEKILFKIDNQLSCFHFMILTTVLIQLLSKFQRDRVFGGQRLRVRILGGRPLHFKHSLPLFRHFRERAYKTFAGVIYTLATVSCCVSIWVLV